MESPDAFSEDSAGAELINGSPSTAAASEADAPPDRVRRRPIPKKGHTKSRRGCHNCKRRKVKCQETLPECLNCKRLGLHCVYPQSQSASALAVGAGSNSASGSGSVSGSASAPSSELSQSPSPAAALRTTPGTFTMEDLRFFHHFLVTAYPPLPMEGDAVWQGVAALSHKYDYLVHAMLGLAASHLNLYTGDCTQQALSHRVTAIQALNESLSQPCRSAAEGDARFGAIMALTFQASCMPEGMLEFLSMIRGCHIIGASSVLDFGTSLFREFTAEGYSDSVKRLIGPAGLVLEPHEEALFDEFLVSLRSLAPLCSSPLEVRFLAMTERISKLAKSAVTKAFYEFTKLYDMVADASNEEFRALVDATNYPAQLLLIHFLFIEFAIGELCLGQHGTRFGFRRRAVLAWLNGILETLPTEYRSYVGWPLKYARTLVSGLTTPFKLDNLHPSMPVFLAPKPTHSSSSHLLAHR